MRIIYLKATAAHPRYAEGMIYTVERNQALLDLAKRHAYATRVPVHMRGQATKPTKRKRRKEPKESVETPVETPVEEETGTREYLRRDMTAEE